MPARDSEQNMENAELTYVDGVLTLRFERARDTGDEADHSFSDNCYYFIFPVDGGDHSNGVVTQHIDTPIISAERICIGQTQQFNKRA